MSKLADFVKWIERVNWSYRSYLRQQDHADAEYITPRQALPPDAWQEFKARFVSHIGNEAVQRDGLTHREWLEYLRSGKRDYEWDDEDFE